MTDTPRRELLFEAAKGIREAFVKYNDNFGRITRRAKQRFETRDWRGAERDFGERLELYTKSVERSVGALQRLFGATDATRSVWPALKQTFGARVDGIADGAFSKTFFNSISRRIFQTVGTDPETEFLDIHFNIRDAQRHAVECRSYLNWGAPREIIRQLLTDCEFGVPYAHLDEDVSRIQQDIERHAAAVGVAQEMLRLDFLPAVFYQSSRAYLIGKVFWLGSEAPLVIALRHDDNGIAVDQIMMSVDDISILFGFTRSYFFVDLEPVEGAVHFINSLLPHKPIDELYTVLGRVRQGKTERYRQFSNHLASCRDRFVHAPGDRGLVMICFTLPSYDLVFKVIRDRFGFPKNTSRDEVMSKYQFVFKHDRAGRLIDTQEFTDIGFPLDKFDAAVIEELMHEAGESTRIDGDQLVIRHLYVERRLRPLNLFVREADRSAAEAAVLDYGQALRDLAHANIFPGDLLIKNFGVTRHGRCIFYDYDELCLVTDCNFREVPESPFDEDEMRPRPWFHVNANDVFPEEFMRFLALDEGLKQTFMSRHADLLSVEFWRGVQQLHIAAEGSDRRAALHPGQPRPRARPAFS
jgi:isocitrate dehydrogenase kinase/phosphatase